MSNMDLSGKVVIVTGAGRGLGRAYALGLAAAGAGVVVNDADSSVADEVVDEIVGCGGQAVAVGAPVGSSETAERLVAEAVSAFGRLDALIANAGILRDKVVWKMTDEDFDAVIDVHLRGTFTCVRAAVNRMREQGEGGRIIAVGSPAGQKGNFGQTNYSAAKAAIVGMVRTWALELGKAGIDVNAVIPVAATAMTRTIPSLAEHVSAWEDHGTPLPDPIRKGRGFGVPDDVVGLMVYLVSDAAEGITGQNIGIGGDRVLLWTQPGESRLAYCDGGWSADGLAAVWDTTLGLGIARRTGS
jgi:NAD(P)-dependent dehydrogenase (short-subunit alcohol dehydrogenase family)